MNEQVAEAIGQLTNNFWLTTILYLFVAGIGTFIGGFLLKKAGHLATKEDFSDFRAQLKVTTRDTEEIKQQLSRHTWVNQQQWTARELYYGKLLTHLHNFNLALNGLSGYYTRTGSEHTPDSLQDAHFHQLKGDAGQAFHEIQKLLGPAALYLSSTTVEALTKMLSRHWELVEFEVCCTAEYAEQARNLSDSAYGLVIAEAKQHLGIK